MHRVGVFSGTFDPVHRGHIEACVVALGVLTLDTVLILIEKQPRRKTGVAGFIDRANMIELATTDYPSLRLVDFESDHITTQNTLKYLQDNFAGGEYWYILGSDMLRHIEDWEEHEKLFKNMNICVVLRDNDDLKKIKKQIEKLQDKYPATEFVILPSVWSPISSSIAKEKLLKGELLTALDPAVQEYIKKHKLYGTIG